MKFYEQDEYQEKCFALFLELQSEISAVLPSAQIEHIGSSSVPGAFGPSGPTSHLGRSLLKQLQWGRCTQSLSSDTK